MSTAGTITEHACRDCGARVVAIAVEEFTPVPYFARCPCGGTLVANLVPGERAHDTTPRFVWREVDGAWRPVDRFAQPS
jgi:hypothetical protein